MPHYITVWGISQSPTCMAHLFLQVWMIWLEERLNSLWLANHYAYLQGMVPWLRVPGMMTIPTHVPWAELLFRLVASVLYFRFSFLKAILVNYSGTSLLYIKFSKEFLHWEAKAEVVGAPKLPDVKGVGHSSTIISKVETPSEAEEQVFWDSWFKFLPMGLHNLMENKNPDMHQLFTLILNFAFSGDVALAWESQGSLQHCIFSVWVGMLPTWFHNPNS